MLIGPRINAAKVRCKPPRGKGDIELVFPARASGITRAAFGRKSEELTIVCLRVIELTGYRFV